MLDIGWSELMVIGVVALVVVGPKDLPVMFRTLGRFTAKARSMSREFTRAMEAAAKESGVGDVAKDLQAVTSARSLGLGAIENAATRFEKWDPMKKVATVPKMVVPAVALADSQAAAATIGPATEALAAERAEQRAAVIKAAETRAEARTAAATASLNDLTPAAKPVRVRRKAKVVVVVAEGVVAEGVVAEPAPPPVEVKPKPRKAKPAVVANILAAPVKPARRSRVKAGEA